MTDQRELAAKLLTAIRLSRCNRCSGHGENYGDTCALCDGLERLLRAIVE